MTPTILPPCLPWPSGGHRAEHATHARHVPLLLASSRSRPLTPSAPLSPLGQSLSSRRPFPSGGHRPQHAPHARHLPLPLRHRLQPAAAAHRRHLHALPRTVEGACVGGRGGGVCVGALFFSLSSSFLTRFPGPWRRVDSPLISNAFFPLTPFLPTRFSPSSQSNPPSPPHEVIEWGCVVIQSRLAHPSAPSGPLFPHPPSQVFLEDPAKPGRFQLVASQATRPAGAST